MRQFIIRLTVFIFPLLVIALSLDFIMSYYLSQSNINPGEYEVWNDIYDSTANCDIAIHGSSRAWVHIDPKILSDSLSAKVYNFGIDGHNFWLQYLRYLEHIKYNEKPSTIILSVDVFSLQKQKNLYQLDQFLPYMLWNSNIKEYTSSYMGYDKFDYYLPLIRYSGKSKALRLIKENIVRGKATKKYRQNGFLGMKKQWNADYDRAKNKLESYEIITDLNIVVLFEKFIKECEVNNIELILVYTPEHIKGQNFVSNRDNIIQIYRDFSMKYSIQFYDFSNDSLCLDKKYFYNASHLNHVGAEIFSKKLASTLKVQKRKSVLGN